MAVIKPNGMESGQICLVNLWFEKKERDILELGRAEPLQYSGAAMRVNTF